MNPILHIVMGPNGAGKSTFGSLYTDGIPVYDPDKRGMEIRTYIKNLSKSQRKQLYPAYTGAAERSTGRSSGRTRCIPAVRLERVDCRR